MDLGAAEYRGALLGWLSPTGVVAPHFRELWGEGWLRSFGGGLLVTCGLQNVGEPSERDGEELGLHGRISNTPATLLSCEARWDGEGCHLEMRAEARESRVFGANLVLGRTISAHVGEACVSTPRMTSVSSSVWMGRSIALSSHSRNRLSLCTHQPRRRTVLR
jgi:hypothetical protein